MAEPQHDAHPLSRRDFIKLMATGVGGALLASCNGRDSNLSPIQAVSTQQALAPEGQRIMDHLPPFILSGLARIEIKSLSYAPQTKIGTGQVYLETPTHLVLVMAEHIGKGMAWHSVDVSFPFGFQTRNIHIDARIDAPNGPKPTDRDWWIRDITPYSDVENGILHPIRAIVIRKPAECTQFVIRPEYGILEPDPKSPTKGDKLYCGGFPGDTRGQLVFTELIFKRDVPVPEFGSEFYYHEYRGAAAPGMSGAAIVTSSGTCVSIFSRGSNDASERLVYGIPFAKYNPLQNILSMLQKS